MRSALENFRFKILEKVGDECKEHTGTLIKFSLAGLVYWPGLCSLGFGTALQLQKYLGICAPNYKIQTG